METKDWYAETAAYLSACISGNPETAVILGSGLGALADHIDLCVDLASLLEQTLELNRQVFLFTGDKHIGKRVKNVAEKQVIYCEQL